MVESQFDTNVKQTPTQSEFPKRKDQGSEAKANSQESQLNVQMKDESQSDNKSEHGLQNDLVMPLVDTCNIQNKTSSLLLD